MAVYTGGYKNDNSVRSLRGAITYAAGTTGAIGSTTLFTVTGDVALTMVAAKCTTDLTSAGAPTWTFGVTGNTDIFTVTSPDVTGWDANEWCDTSAGTYSVGHGYVLAPTQAPQPISGNIIQTIASATITGGVVRWYVQWVPLSGDGNVALHANLSAF